MKNVIEFWLFMLVFVTVFLYFVGLPTLFISVIAHYAEHNPYLGLLFVPFFVLWMSGYIYVDSWKR